MARQVQHTADFDAYRADETSAGIVVDLMKIPDAMEQGVHVPPKALFFSPSKEVFWPVIEFIPSKHASSHVAKKVLIPQMSVDYMNAMGTYEARRLQVPLILAWVRVGRSSESYPADV